MTEHSFNLLLTILQLECLFFGFHDYLHSLKADVSTLGNKSTIVHVKPVK
jgi:hypothetical protein